MILIQYIRKMEVTVVDVLNNIVVNFVVLSIRVFTRESVYLSITLMLEY